MTKPGIPQCRRWFGSLLLTALLYLPSGPRCAAQPPEAPAAQPRPLTVEAVVEQVIARNPTLAQMTAAWQAASARYPQARSLDDPMFGAMVGPASIGSRDVDFAYRLEVAQKFPFPGKRQLRGQAALAEAGAAGNEVDEARLQLTEAAVGAFADYFVVTRSLAITEENLRLLQLFRQNALDRLKAKQVTLQDVRQAEVEIGKQQDRQLELEQLRQVAVARLNTLMHLPPDAPLPPPPASLPAAAPPADAATLRAAALARRPDLLALNNRLAAEEANLGLARKEYYPDVEVVGAYDAFWQPRERDLRPMVGVRLNLPVYLDRRRGAVNEAQAKIAQRRAEVARLIDTIQFQVQEAFAQVDRSAKSVRLYQQTILPAAESNVKLAIDAYTTVRIPFLSLLEAQRSAVGLRERYYETVAEYLRRRATLERVTGGPLPQPGERPQPAPEQR